VDNTRKAELLLRDELLPSLVQLLELFEYEHLPKHLQEISKKFHDLAWDMADTPTQRYAEQTVCIRKLLEAKDCAVRMGVALGHIGANSPPLGG
jgi:hypothetical protein